jgi:glycosyltransferase involved in cell wall biosynthesis
MKIGIVKPDYRISGGFEVVVNRMKYELDSLGHDTQLIHVDATSRVLDDIPCSIDARYYSSNAEFFRYINYFWKYLRMDLQKYDAIISTQPPSFAAQHNRHVALFYHHMKIYYDLSILIQEVGLQQPFHRKALEVVREIDTIALSKVTKILAGSKTIQGRINDFNNISGNVDVIYAGIEPEIYNFDGHLTYEYPIVVGRHEFPKRPELFVAAMKKLPRITGKIIGSGGRTDDLIKIDKILSLCVELGIEIPDEEIWKKMSNGFFDIKYEKHYRDACRRKISSNVIFTGKVSNGRLLEEYAKSLCVVCPAYQEDYGLTAIEAMAFRKPVIACKDGGGYAELIEDGINGFLVEPCSSAIADAVRKFVDNPDLAVRMGLQAYEFSRKFTWKNTSKKLAETLVF